MRFSSPPKPFPLGDSITVTCVSQPHNVCTLNLPLLPLTCLSLLPMCVQCVFNVCSMCVQSGNCYLLLGLMKLKSLAIVLHDDISCISFFLTQSISAAMNVHVVVININMNTTYDYYLFIDI